mmetsp:Transcript_1641/g.1140  ORF Transcript_1641/g.1140 Transcript_1641/m.1140 type:complete len:106 (-) Transcript_1641:784-1101(-)
MEDGNAMQEQLEGSRLMRHGYGVQIFGKTANNNVCKYEGNWNKDRKQGQGNSVFPDDSMYSGDWTADTFNGFGKFIWNNGCTYEGYWKQGRMEGMGIFRHPSGEH